MASREQQLKYEGAFGLFWDAYPRKTDRHQAFLYFIELGEGGWDLTEIINRAKAFARNTDPSDLRYTPSAKAWLRDRRWEDNDLFTDQFTSTRDWFVRAYNDADVSVIEKKYGHIYPQPPVPDECADPVAFHRDARKTWIGKIARHVLHHEPLE